jgi:hypothetical protein
MCESGQRSRGGEQRPTARRSMGPQQGGRMQKGMAALGVASRVDCEGCGARLRLLSRECGEPQSSNPLDLATCEPPILATCHMHGRPCRPLLAVTPTSPMSFADSDCKQRGEAACCCFLVTCSCHPRCGAASHLSNQLAIYRQENTRIRPREYGVCKTAGLNCPGMKCCTEKPDQCDGCDAMASITFACCTV